MDSVQGLASTDTTQIITIFTLVIMAIILFYYISQGYAKHKKEVKKYEERIGVEEKKQSEQADKLQELDKIFNNIKKRLDMRQEQIKAIEQLQREIMAPKEPIKQAVQEIQNKIVELRDLLKEDNDAYQQIIDTLSTDENSTQKAKILDKAKKELAEQEEKNTVKRAKELLQQINNILDQILQTPTTTKITEAIQKIKTKLKEIQTLFSQ